MHPVSFYFQASFDSMNTEGHADPQIIKKVSEMLRELVSLKEGTGIRNEKVSETTVMLQEIDNEKLEEAASMVQQLLGHEEAPSIDELAEVIADKHFHKKLLTIAVQNTEWLQKKVMQLQEELDCQEKLNLRIMKKLNGLVKHD